MRFTLAELERRVAIRSKASAKNSYTRQLLDKGVSQCAKKFGEEAIETALAAVGESRKRLIAETADLSYHLMVMLPVTQHQARRSRSRARPLCARRKSGLPREGFAQEAQRRAQEAG